MSSEPNKKMEELLKHHAEQRKAESRGDFELHPATRNLLQGEVARTFGKTDGAKKGSLFFLLWPRLAIIGAFTGLLVATVMTLNRPKQKIQVAQNSPKELAAPAPSAIEKTRMLDDASSVLKREESPASPQVTQPVAEPEVAGYGNASDRFQETTWPAPSHQSIPETKKFGYALTNDIAIGNFSTSTFANAVANGRMESNRATLSSEGIAPATAAQANVLNEPQAGRRFVQQDLRAKYRRNFLSPAQPKILQSFELVQTGNKIRVIENDGSIYDGEILAAGRDKSGEEKSKTSRDQKSEFDFRVAGTNQQLNRIVTFTGNFAVPDAESREDVSRSPKDSARPGLAKQKASAPPGIVQGEVSIAGTNDFQIRAIEAGK